MIWRIQNGAFDGMDPEVVVLMIGSNNTGENSALQIAEAIGVIIHMLQERLPKAHILLLGVFPKAPFAVNVDRNSSGGGQCAPARTGETRWASTTWTSVEASSSPTAH